MTIKSSPFTSLKLNGDDSKQFAYQVREGKLNPHAKSALARGKKALDKMHARHGRFGEGNTCK